MPGNKKISIDKKNTEMTHTKKAASPDDGRGKCE